MVFGGGSRVQKYRHNFAEIFNFNPREYALLCVLLLRGPQTAGELRARAERLAPFASAAEVEATLEGLAGGDDPLVRLLAARPGQKERRYAQLFSGEPADVVPEVGVARVAAPSTGELMSRLEAAERSIVELREELAAFRRQFD